MWNQKNLVKINECKTIADLFRVGCNWDSRRKKLLKINRLKAQRMADELQMRLERICKFMYETGVIADVINEPDWFYNIKIKPFNEAMKNLNQDN